MNRVRLQEALMPFADVSEGSSRVASLFCGADATPCLNRAETSAGTSAFSPTASSWHVHLLQNRECALREGEDFCVQRLKKDRGSGLKEAVMKEQGCRSLFLSEGTVLLQSTRAHLFAPANGAL